MAGDGDAIAEQSRRHERLKTQIDTAFEQLEAATEAYEKEARRFDERLSELSPDG